jgi:hypothetical protein
MCRRSNDSGPESGTELCKTTRRLRIAEIQVFDEARKVVEAIGTENARPLVSGFCPSMHSLARSKS